ncbi:hypothetical protein [Solidesulfovibrio carbinolicus]|uniref:hypothetical protein n=1 Tax=Solidesulfovibrio carbinolicus TaxID=296842 RepID=UPI0013ECAD68|nr:hypothetical protein [Solidesulfovibrio carbinolicus]
MKKIVIFTVVSCLLATSMAFAGTKKKTKKATKDGSYSVVEIMKDKKKAKKTATPAN